MIDKFIKLLSVLSIGFAGADRVNIFSSSFEYFNFTPYLLFSLLYIILTLTIKFNTLKFSWIRFNSLSFYFLVIFIVTTLLSVFVSQDIFYSSKRILLLLFILINFIIIISYYTDKELQKVLFYSSILGSIIFLIFNVIMIYLWINYIEFESSYINLIPNKIAYFMPRLGGASQDVNRGGIVLLFYTIILFKYYQKSNFIKFLVIINIISVFFTLSRTVFIFIISFSFLYIISNFNKKDNFKIFKYIFVFILFSFSVLFYLDNIKLIELDYLIEERFTIDFDLTRDTSSGIHLRLIYEGIIKRRIKRYER